jgi:non-specific serine/threonine protein kinase
MGERRLKDLVRPEHVYQLNAPGLSSEFPPLKTLDAREHNLPVQPTSFIGRETEMQQIRRRLESSHLVTVTGAGGAGKTRLAVQVAAERIDDFADGVWFVDLAVLTDAELVPQTVATVLGLKEQSGCSWSSVLVKELQTREMLLLLDNCEHVIYVCARMCQELMAGAPRLRVLATSREPLRIPGERCYRVPSLATPDPHAATTVDDLIRSPSVQLFIDRAKGAATSFRLTEKSAATIASICTRLDGIPLAIELAAARVRAMSVEEVHQRLDRRFSLLTGGARTSLPRQQTLRSAIDWSHDLLGASEKSLFYRLAVFAGGCTLEAAEEVCAGEGVDRDEILDLLTSLTDKNLLLAEEREDETRYRFLDTLRQYARGRLQESGSSSDWHGRHLRYFVSLVERAEPHLTGPEQVSWLGRLEVEHENVRSALAWGSGREAEQERTLRLAGAFWRFWYMRGNLTEGRGRLTTLLNATADRASDSLRAKVASGAGIIAAQQGDYAAAKQLYEESLSIRRGLDDRLGIAASLANLANVAAEQSDYQLARALHHESLGIRRERQDRWGIAMSLCNLGLLAMEQGDYLNARAWGDEALAIRRELGDRWATAVSLRNLGLVLLEQGDFEAARALHDEALTISRQLDDKVGIALAINDLAKISCREEDWHAARVAASESLAMFRRLGEQWGTAQALSNLSIAAFGENEISTADALQRESLQLRIVLHDRRGIAEGLEVLACVALRLNYVSRAVRLWAGASNVRESIGLPQSPGERPFQESQMSMARTLLGNEQFALEWQTGRDLPMDEMIKYGLNTDAAAGESE